MTEGKVSKFLPWIAAMAIFMQFLDSTILNTALPSIAKDLDKSPLEMQSVLIAYVLTIALLIPLSGWLSDKFGSKNIFILSVTVFTIGSFLCALSVSLKMLVCMRIIQAVGGSMMVPVSRLTLIYSYPKHQLLRVINFITIPGLLGPVIGPTLGGWLVEIASWHWIFLINIPIGILGILVAGKSFPNYKIINGKFDFIGFILFSLSLVSLSLSLEFAVDGKTTMVNIMILSLLSMSLLYTYVIYSKKVVRPIIDLDLFKIRTLKIGIIGNLITRLGIGGVPLMLPLMLQVGFGKSPTVSGVMLIFSAISTIVAKSWVIPWVKRFGYRKLLIYNTIILGISISLFSLPDKNTPIFWLIPILILYGFFNSVQMTSMNSISLAELTPVNASGGNTILSVTQQLSISFGISLSSIILRGFNLSDVFTEVSSSFRATLVVLGLITIVSSFTFKYLKSEDGAEMSGIKKIN
ncbi:drug resistance transporter, EmrB/QacA subfamily [Apibacter mensalis]|uniref:Drug resistance transporter, EmrB/QacA subfamily n=1 Tax=Apibacter mensalis TaxID=1586267 RepID=A0A0X3AS11_9FLAO|nr:DHA2 family efflux MFS transporter permease subunit [Apibacter mensalis]CVK16668.1 drug resistance transporter, EmrB/QacA subfamily [Apibacter mensalis]